MIKFQETANDHSMVVRPEEAVVALTCTKIDAIVYIILGIDQSTAFEPLPLGQRPLYVILSVRCSIGKLSGEREEQLIGDGCVGSLILVPPDASTFRRVTFGHVLEDPNCVVHVNIITREVIHLQPSERPPALIFVVCVQKSIAELGIGQCNAARDIRILEGIRRSQLAADLGFLGLTLCGLCEGVLEDGHSRRSCLTID